MMSNGLEETEIATTLSAGAAACILDRRSNGLAVLWPLVATAPKNSNAAAKNNFIIKVDFAIKSLKGAKLNVPVAFC